MSSANTNSVPAVVPRSGVQTACYSGEADLSSPTSHDHSIAMDAMTRKTSRSHRSSSPRPTDPRSSLELLANVSSAEALRPLEKASHRQGGDSPSIEESNAARIERLGRQRPEAFRSIWAEVGFVFSLAMSQVLSVGTPLFIYGIADDRRNTSFRASQWSCQHSLMT